MLVLSIFGVRESKASHAAGGELTYQAQGNGQYLVTFTFYRDCFGIDAPTSQILDVSSATCNFTQTYTMTPTGPGVEITHPCSTAVSTCQGGSVTGMQEFTYTALVSLPANCVDWEFNTSVGSRNQAVTTIVAPDSYNLYVDAFLNNSTVENNSPTFSDIPIAFICVGQINHLNAGATDADGDSLSYSFIAPRSDGNTTLPYEVGYSIADPIVAQQPVTINPLTGDITMYPSQADVAIVTVMVTEWRNGQVIGTIMRDMQVYLVACSNSLPTASGIDTTSTFSASACIGGVIDFNIISGDTDPNDIDTMYWNQAIPGATFTISGSPHPTGHFHWAPTPADAQTQPYQFIVTVRDNACPSNGQQSYVYSITVSNMTIQLTSTPSVQCNGSHNGSASAIATGNPPLTYSWITPGGNVLNGQSVSHLEGGPYTLNVMDGNNCVGVQQFTIAEPSPIQIPFTVTNAGCGGTTGSITVNPNGGSPNYTYHWTPGGQTTQTATNLNTGNYRVVVTDSHNCTATDTTSVHSNTPVNFTLTTTPATCLALDGSATVTHTGGTGSYSYEWTPNIPGNTTTSHLSNLMAGGYSVIATDLGTGCSETLPGIVANASGLSATITSSADATCSSSEDGSATVSASGGQPPYSYLWPNGDTLPTTNHLSPDSNLIVEVRDYNGCLAVAMFNIGFLHPSPAVDLGIDTMPCIGSTFTMDAGNPGSTYLWSDSSVAQTLSVTTSGNYSVLVTNSFGCESFDNVNVNFVVCFNNHTTTSHDNVSADLIVYPNPSDNDINVAISRIQKTEVTLVLTDILGNNLMMSKETQDFNYSKKIDIHSYPAGIYLLKVEYNGEIHTTRIIKQ